MSAHCRLPGCGRELEEDHPYEDERLASPLPYWLCPCCDRSSSPCEHRQEKYRQDRLEDLERRLRALPRKDRDELFRRLGQMDGIHL